MKNIQEDITALKTWFYKNKRDFPWRKNPTPYGVWVSEIMLQQTRASVVIPYYEKWMDLFPDVYALAAASLNRVLKTWEGLGYYSRAKNLLLGAKEVVEKNNGHLPSSYEELVKIRGIGPYTAGAILAFGFKKKSVAIDANVTRVLSRFFLIEKNISLAATQKKLHFLAKSMLCFHEPWVTVEAIIELGALLCERKPKCLACPLQKRCKAFLEKKEKLLPIKPSKPAVILLKRVVFVIQHKNTFFIQKVEKNKVMADLYEFPYIEWDEKMPFTASCAKFVKKMGGKIEHVYPLSPVNQSFTRYRAQLFPFLCVCEFPNKKNKEDWFSLKMVKSFPFSSGHRKILKQLG